MKTLDEVIKAHEFCVNSAITGAVCEECPAFAKPDCEIREDALHYLKELKEERERKNQMIADVYKALEAEKKRITEAVIYNPPLTWEQLKKMEGKPIWVEPVKEWMLITEVDEKDCGIWLLSLDGLDYDLMLHGNWQAYRKERE